MPEFNKPSTKDLQVLLAMGRSPLDLKGSQVKGMWATETQERVMKGHRNAKKTQERPGTWEWQEHRCLRCFRTRDCMTTAIHFWVGLVYCPKSSVNKARGFSSSVSWFRELPMRPLVQIYILLVCKHLIIKSRVVPTPGPSFTHQAQWA